MTPEGVAATFAVRYRTLEVQDLHLKEMVMNKLFPSVKIGVFCGTYFGRVCLIGAEKLVLEVGNEK